MEAYGSASVEAYGSASVQASGSASVRASDSASVLASDSASVEAYGSASVEAYGSATILVFALFSLKVKVEIHGPQACAVDRRSGRPVLLLAEPEKPAGPAAENASA